MRRPLDRVRWDMELLQGRVIIYHLESRRMKKHIALYVIPLLVKGGIKSKKTESGRHYLVRKDKCLHFKVSVFHLPNNHLEANSKKPSLPACSP